MTLGGHKLAIKYLNPDLCYAAWVIGGSVSRAQAKLYAAGIVHPVTGVMPSKMGIHYTAKTSEFFAEFVERRVKNPGMSQTPTKEEYAEAKILFEQLIGPEVAKVKQLREQYRLEPLGA